MTEQVASPTAKKAVSLSVLILMGLLSPVVWFGYQYYATLALKLTSLQSQLQTTQKTLQQLQLITTQNAQRQIAITVTDKPLIIWHLIHLADISLKTMHDAKAALTYLVTAKQYLIDNALTNSENLLGALTKDIIALELLPLTKQTEILTKIQALGMQLETLPSLPPKIKPDNATTIAQPSTPTKYSSGYFLNLVEQIWEKALATLKQFIIIRQQASGPILLPEQIVTLQLNLQTQLLQLELAVMQQQEPLYQKLLASLLTTLPKYFPKQQLMLDLTKVIQELAQYQLAPKLPNQLNSVTTLKELAQELAQQPLAPVKSS